MEHTTIALTSSPLKEMFTLILLPSTTYMMVYVVIIPLGIIGLVHVTRTVLLLIPVTVLMVGGVEAVNNHIRTL